MTKVKPTNKAAKDGFRKLKNGSIHKKKQQKFKNTPTGKVALIDGTNTPQKSNGKLSHQNGNRNHKISPKQQKSPNGSNKHSKSPKNLNSTKSPKIKVEEEEDDDDSSIDDINEGISIKEEISAPEDEVDDDSSSSETEAVPDIFGQSLTEETDEDDEEFDADSDEDEEETEENKGVKMFKGLQPKVEPKESSDDDEEDEDDDEEDDDDDSSSNDDEETTPGLKDLFGGSLADESDDEDFKSGEDSEEDEDTDEEVDQSVNSSNATSTTDEDDDDDEDNDDDEDEEEDSSDDEAAPDLTALLGNSIAEDSDDEDFEGDENDEDDEDEDMSDDDEDDDDVETPSSKNKIKVVKSEAVDEEEEDDDDDDGKNESFDSMNKSDADNSVTSRKVSAKEREERDRRTIFIGNVPKETNVSRIQSMFKKFGTIESIRVRGIIPENPKMPLKVAAIKKKFHSKSKTVCIFVTFENVESAEKALSMNGKKLDGNFLRVDHANRLTQPDQKRTVFLGNLPFTIEDNEIWETFKACGKIESVRIIRDRKTGVGRGFGYINFESADGAVLALDLNGTKIKNRELRVKVSTPEKLKKPRDDKKGKKRQLIQGATTDSAKKLKTGSETAQVAKHNSVNAERRTDKKKRSQGEKQRVNSQSTSPEGKGAGKFQGQKADSKKKSKPNKHAKKKMQMAAKLLAKPKKPAAN